jgi:hypothetical protein
MSFAKRLKGRIDRELDLAKRSHSKMLEYLSEVQPLTEGKWRPVSGEHAAVVRQLKELVVAYGELRDEGLKRINWCWRLYESIADETLAHGQEELRELLRAWGCEGERRNSWHRRGSDRDEELEVKRGRRTFLEHTKALKLSPKGRYRRPTLTEEGRYLTYGEAKGMYERLHDLAEGLLREAASAHERARKAHHQAASKPKGKTQALKRLVKGELLKREAAISAVMSIERVAEELLGDREAWCIRRFYRDLGEGVGGPEGNSYDALTECFRRVPDPVSLKIELYLRSKESV